MLQVKNIMEKSKNFSCSLPRRFSLLLKHADVRIIKLENMVSIQNFSRSNNFFKFFHWKSCITLCL